MFGKKRAVILGAGPSGLLAAHAAEQRGWEVEVYTAPGPDNEPKKSELHGCQYLHMHVPGTKSFETPGAPVSYQLAGTFDQYRRKVYGAGWSGSVSPDEYGPERPHLAWDLRETYDQLWERWLPRIAALEINPRMAASISNVRNQTVFCTIPATALCLKTDEHKFTTQSVWAMGTRTEQNGWALPFVAPDMTVLCNGEDAPRWYRAATVFGHSTLEWPAGARPPISGVVAVNKPLSTDCDCHSRFRRLGRFGKWQKGVLVHTAYEEVRAW